MYEMKSLLTRFNYIADSNSPSRNERQLIGNVLWESNPPHRCLVLPRDELRSGKLRTSERPNKEILWARSKINTIWNERTENERKKLDLENVPIHYREKKNEMMLCHIHSSAWSKSQKWKEPTYRLFFPPIARGLALLTWYVKKNL